MHRERKSGKKLLGPSACEAHVITTTLQKHYTFWPYFSRIHRMYFVSMKIQFPSRVFTSLQNSPGGVSIENTFLTEDIDVVDTQLSSITEVAQSWNLDIDHILSGIFCCAASKDGKQTVTKDSSDQLFSAAGRWSLQTCTSYICK